jgi:hypothetical protein
MSTPEQPATPPLTRKQMRDLRNTGATPVVAAEPVADAPVVNASVLTPPPAPLPRPAEPVAVAAPPVADSSVDLGVSPLTRRQARQQERIRTASVPVITPDVAAAHAAAVAAVTPDAAAVETESTETDASELFGAPAEQDAVDAQESVEVLAEPAAEPEPEPESEPEPEWPFGETARSETVDAADPDAGPGTEVPVDPDEADDFSAVFTAGADDDDGDDAPEQAEESGADDAPERTVSPLLGAAVITGEASAPDLPPSFDQLLSRSATGSIGASNALILTSTGDSPIVAPVTATGEVLITGTLNLPEGLGSIGHAPGAADGKEVDAVLVDGELPAHSSPTPIAASAAISTVKSAGEVIQPPTPEKGSKLMMALAITAGVLALALVGVLILAFVTGVF